LTKTERAAPKEHVVLFYENDTELARIAGAYLTEAVVEGSVAVVVATESHRAILEREVVSIPGRSKRWSESSSSE
jgi:hypothetical protein